LLLCNANRDSNASIYPEIPFPIFRVSYIPCCFQVLLSSVLFKLPLLRRSIHVMELLELNIAGVGFSPAVQTFYPILCLCHTLILRLFALYDFLRKPRIGSIILKTLKAWDARCNLESRCFQGTHVSRSAGCCDRSNPFISHNSSIRPLQASNEPMSFKKTGIFPPNPVTTRGTPTKLSSTKDKVVYASGKTVIVRFYSGS